MFASPNPGLPMLLGRWPKIEDPRDVLRQGHIRHRRATTPIDQSELTNARVAVQGLANLRAFARAPQNALRFRRDDPGM
jgi:hypothetical protein